MSVAADGGEIQDVLQVKSEVMDIVRAWSGNIALLFNDAQGVEHWISVMHKMDAGLRRLGYPTIPLTGSRDDVEQFLVDVDTDLSQYSYFRALKARAGFSSFVFFTDALTGGWVSACLS